MCRTSDNVFCVWWPFVTWSWPRLNIKHYSVRSFPYCLSIWRKFWSKTASFEVSTARNEKAFDFDLWHELDLTRDLVLKNMGMLEMSRWDFECRVARRSSLSAVSRSWVITQSTVIAKNTRFFKNKMTYFFRNITFYFFCPRTINYLA